jgi:exodeoxyribonuclease VII small subunit
MMTKKDAFDYRTKAAELEQVLADLQDPEIQIDEATKLHARGLKLAEEIETYLKQAENAVRKHAAEG